MAIVAEDLSTLSLPDFDPEVGRSAGKLDQLFDEPLRRAAGSKAGLVVAGTAIISPWERRSAIRCLEDLFERRPGPHVFRLWRDAAPSIDSAETIALAVELKDMWDETPAFWLYRSGPSAQLRYSDSSRGSFSWRSALLVARAAPSASAAHLLNDDLLDAWMQLDRPCPGYWGFATFVEGQVLADEAEIALFDVIARNAKRRAQFGWH